MRLLLDTHIFAWFIDGDTRLPPALERAIRDGNNTVFLSVAPVWEASIKYHLGRWPMSQPPEILFPIARRRYFIGSLPATEEDVAETAKLPSLHKDPFDRIIIGQAIQHSLSLVTVDEAIRAYPMAPVFAP